jgi:hemoglobin-like flavoprotein
MDASDIQEMQASFSKIYAKKAELAERFYVHLFTLLPEVEPLFDNDFAKQKEMFASMLTYCLKGVAHNKSLTHTGTTLAKTHARYGLGPRETEMAGRAVMAALQDVLGDELTSEQRDIWEEAVRGVMQLILADGRMDLESQS